MVLINDSPSGPIVDTSTGTVITVFGRIGNVVAILNDYSASLVDNNSGVVGATVADALDTLAAAIPGTFVSTFIGRSGAVVAVLNDYDASLVNNDSSVVGATVADALDTLDGGIPANIVETIITTSGGLASADTITPTSAVDGAVTVNLPNIKIDTAARENTVIGVGTPALVSLFTRNTLYGDGSGAALLTSGGDATLNTLIGHNAGSSITTGNTNTCLGAPASTLTTGDSNLIIGPSADVPTAGTDGYLNLNRALVGFPSAFKLVVNAGTIDPSSNLDLFGIFTNSETVAPEGLHSTDGTHPAVSKTFVTDRDPNGVITGVAGDYVRQTGASATTWISRAAGTVWIDIGNHPTTVTDMKLVTFAEVFDEGDSGASATIDFSTAAGTRAQKRLITLDAATVALTLTFSQPGNYRLYVVQDGSTPATTLTFAVTDGDARFPQGNLRIGAAANSISLVSIDFDGTDGDFTSSPDSQTGTVTFV